MAEVTPASLRKKSPKELVEFYDSLRADVLPLGTYEGEVLTPGFRAIWPVWRGKVFTNAHRHAFSADGLRSLTVVTVVNRIGPWLLIPGDVTLRGSSGEVVIDYPQLGIQDHLKPVSATVWLGRMDLKGRTIWFTLEQTT
jgi:hypothetical protein